MVIQSRAKTTQIRKSHSKLSSGKASAEEDFVIIQRAIASDENMKAMTIPASLAQSKIDLDKQKETVATKFLPSKAETDGQEESRS